MSGLLKAERIEFAGLLGDDVKPFPPSKLGVGGFVVPGDPWLERAETFGKFRIRLDGLVLFKAVNNETATDELNEAVEAIVLRVVASDWNLATVAAPRRLQNEGESASFLGVQITATKPIGL